VRADIAALPFENPKLSVNANIGPNDKFTERLEAAIKLREILVEPRVVIDATAERIEDPGP